MNELVTMLKGLPIWSYFVAGLILFYLLLFIFYSKYAKNRKKTLMNQNPEKLPLLLQDREFYTKR